MFEVEKKYSKKEIYNILSVPIEKQRGAWDTGYREYNNEIYIFVNVGIEGRTGHKYKNYWIGDLLHWEAKTNSNIKQPIIRKLLDDKFSKHILTRIDNRQPFVYEGLGAIFNYIDSTPVRIIWEFNSLNPSRTEKGIDEITDNRFIEGKHRKITVNSYERNPFARRECLGYHGFSCKICGFHFEKFYGEIGKRYVQVHHLIHFSEITEEYVIDPIKDMIPVCANCHAMIHRKNPILSPDELKSMIPEQ